MILAQIEVSTIATMTAVLGSVLGGLIYMINWAKNQQ